MTNDEHIFDGYAGDIAMSASTAKDFTYVRFDIGNGFKDEITKDLKLADGRTVGQANRDWLHEKLDLWIDENLKETK